jgi:putative addiction module component (TIGR02574 family)
MTEQATKLLEEALKLPSEARAAIAGRLMESLDEQVDKDAEAAWAKEIARRLEEVDSGKVTPIPWVEARRRILGGGNDPDPR